MSTKAGELLDTMSIRLEMQEDGVTNPSQHIKKRTKTLVGKLSKINANEKINIKTIDDIRTHYIRVKTGEVLAE